MNNINRDSSPTVKKEVSDMVYDTLSDYLFEKVNFVSFPFSQVAVGGYSSTTVYGGQSRLMDTSEGRVFKVGQPSRMRCSFYVVNPNNIKGYILSPAVYDSFASLNTFSDMNIFRSYVGLKIDRGAITVAVKEVRQDEVNYPTNFSFSGTGATDTYSLEIFYNGPSTEVLINNERVGEFSTNFVSGDPQKSYLHLMSPAISYGGTVNIGIENYQFIQAR